MFGIEIIDAALVPAMIVALPPGPISFWAPSGLPMLPPYLPFMGGATPTATPSSDHPPSKAVFPAVFFLPDLSRFFLFLGFHTSPAA